MPIQLPGMLSGVALLALFVAAWRLLRDPWVALAAAALGALTGKLKEINRGFGEMQESHRRHHLEEAERSEGPHRFPGEERQKYELRDGIP